MASKQELQVQQKRELEKKEEATIPQVIAARRPYCLPPLGAK